ncbi:MAG: malonyl CoA-ACP transacylase [Spirochaetes bacterium RBG_13_68_11]|nr:MAG: malonyl CoA-ACP transacylase [Spirochaetes bacterium RBG_13_68_11]
MRTCLLFPGQGAQYPRMGMDLWEASPKVRELFLLASDAAGFDVKRALSEGTAEELAATDKAQVLITLVDLSAAAVLVERGIEPGGCAGFSLGEYAALCTAGIVGVEPVFRIVKVRGELMEKASRGLDAAGGKPGMAAVLGLPAERVAAVAAGIEGVFVANHNSPVQLVLSGTAAGLSRAEELLKREGAKRFIRLKVSGPFHSPLMEGARVAFEEALAGFAFAEPVLPVYSNVTAGPIASGAEARALCGRQVVSPVRWVDEETRLAADGYVDFREAGPGTVLTGLFKALRPDVDCRPAGTLEAIGR